MSTDSIVRGWFAETMAKAPPPNQLGANVWLEQHIPELVAALGAPAPVADVSAAVRAEDARINAAAVAAETGA